MAIKNKVQLITYPDSMGGSLRKLSYVLDTYLPGIFNGGIHILPPYPSSGDRGFAPLTYLEIAPQFGDWKDIKILGESYDILLDLMVNHISAKSEYFQNYLKNGQNSKYADLFINLDKIWSDGCPPENELKKIFLRRKEPFSKFAVGSTGKVEKIWTTFGKTTPSEQIDLDVNSPATRELLTEFLANFGKNSVKIVRLDAIGYVIKKPGTSCFFVEPEIYEFLEWIKRIASEHQIELLPEVHAHYSTQFKLARSGYWIYDFVLPYLVLEALIFKDGNKLCEYLEKRPRKQFTMLDCHDGIPVKPDLNDLYDSKDARRIVDICIQRGGNLSLIFSPDHRDPDGFDVHQIRGTYYSLLDCNDDAYLAARAIQFFTPGIPQVYYVGLLAGTNDEESVKLSGEGREVNRHNYDLEEIAQNLDREVVQRLLKLIRFRNEHPAFDGAFHILESSQREIRLSWKNDKNECSLFIDLERYKTLIMHTNEQGKSTEYLV